MMLTLLYMTLPVAASVSSLCQMTCRLTGDSKFPIGCSMSVTGCLSLCVGPVTQCQMGLAPTHLYAVLVYTLRWLSLLKKVSVKLLNVR